MMQRTERKLCSEAQLFRGLEKLYGSLDSEELAERLDIPIQLYKNKYTNIQTKKYTNVQIQKYTNIQTNIRLDMLGLPEDKYDAAAITVAVMHHAASEEEKFVDRFMWAMNDHGHM